MPRRRGKDKKAFAGQMRWHWLGNMTLQNGYKYGAEIGVRKGENMMRVLSINSELRMIAVDPWKVLQVYRSFLRSMKSNAFKRRIDLMRMTSLEAAPKVADGSLDFVFIDANHSYEMCLSDLWAWSPKVREGGMISGHDVHFSGVKQALIEFFPEGYEKPGIDKCWYVVKEI